MTNAIPVHAVHVPTAAPRASPANVEVMTASPAGVEHRARDALQAPRDDEHRSVRCGGAEHRGHAERGDPDDEQASRPEQIAERPTDEEQRAERQEIRVDDPLLQREAAAEIALNRRQRDVDDARVDEDDDRPENAGDQHQPVARVGRQVFDTRRPKEAGSG